MDNTKFMGKGLTGSGKIREAIVNGIFYPDDTNELKDNIQVLLDACKTKKSDAFAIISPHAGYRYAGDCMASAFKAVQKRMPKTIVLLAPIHNNPVNQIILPESKYFLTPLGSIEVDQQYIDELLECSTGIVQNDIPHLGEHCIEIQLPFIRYLFPEAKIVPILLGMPTDKNIKILANALQLTFSNLFAETLFIVTANLTSYIQGKDAEKEAELFLSLIETCDAGGIKEAVRSRKISSCGAGCVASLLSFRGMPLQVEVLNRNSSVAANNDPERMVHYAAVSFESE